MPLLTNLFFQEEESFSRFYYFTIPTFWRSEKREKKRRLQQM